MLASCFKDNRMFSEFEFDVDTWLRAVHVHQPGLYKQARRNNTIQGMEEDGEYR